jgi:hypothetical protein
MPEVLKQLGVEPVRVSRDPLRFEQAVFVNTSGKALRVELTHIPGVPWYVAVKPKYVTGEVVTADAGDAGGEEGGDNPPTDAEETVTVTREARELMPSPGDFVFDKMGALIGVMVNERFCAVISELGAVEKLDAGDNPPTLEKLKKLSAFPKSLPYGLK